MKKNKVCLLFFLFQLFMIGAFASNKVSRNIDWPKFMQKQDMVWDVIPTTWYESPFLGNGMMGAMIYKQTDENFIRFDVSNCSVHDYRPGTGLYANPRLLIGQMALHPQGEITGGEMRLDLWNAEVRGTIRTTQGAIRFRALVHADEMCLITEISTEGNESYKWEWLPARADSPRYLYFEDGTKWAKNPEDYICNPSPLLSTTLNEGECLQRLNAGGETATTWKEVHKGNKESILFLNISHSYPRNTASRESRSITEKVAKTNIKQLLRAHRRWWNSYYPQSFLTLPDAQKENFYWAQMYKLASATRADRALIDTTGPWLTVTPWPNTWWNLNVQLTYWPLNTSNRLSLAGSLENALYNNLENLKTNVPVSYRADSYALPRSTNLECIGDEVGIPGVSETAEVGNLTWTCHNLWLIYRHQMNDQLLREKLFPLLKGAINYYLHFLTTGEDGKLHLPKTYSPEYGSAADCNYDLMLLRWGCNTLLEITQRLNINDPMINKWKDVQTRLTPYPMDENGLMIGHNTPYAFSHRHYSHLLAAYPLYMLNIENEGDTLLIQKTLDYWQSKKGHHEGYSLTGASSISSAMGKGDQALNYLNGLFGEFLTANTMYKEAGPVIETPLSGAQSIHDMLLQSWGNKIRVFPAVPNSWKDLAFDHFLTEGAFEISARRKDGKTIFIELHSRMGEPCTLVTDIEQPIFKGKRNYTVTTKGNNTYKIDLKKGETVLVCPNGTLKTELMISPIENGKGNIFGQHDAAPKFAAP